MRRLVPIGLTIVGLLAAAPTAGAMTIGISDQQAKTFVNPNYAPLKLKAARYIAPYDVMSDPAQLQRWDEWYKAAKGAHQRILVSFEHSRLPGKEAKAPTAKQYDVATRAFHKAYRSVREINTWNEINRCQTGGRTEGQPKKLCKPKTGVKLLNSYYKSNKKVFKGATIVPLNVLDEQNPGAAINYVRAFAKVAHPKIWGIHNYSDTNRFSSARTKRIIAAMPRGSKVWLLETGGIVRLGDSLPYSEKRAAKALGCMFTIAKRFKQIQRLYVYQFNGEQPGATFDAGLVDANGAPRAGWSIVKRHKAGKC
jgi:hypothetical protein